MLSEDVFSHIENQYSKNLPFVVYRKPGENVFKTLLQHTSEVYLNEDFNARGFIFAPFDNSKQAILIPLEHSKTMTCNTETLLQTNTSLKEIESNVNAEEIHKNLVQKGIDAIKNGNLQKVVLSRCEAMNLNSVKPISVFKKLLQNYPKAFVYCWYHPKIGLWLGATPETLINVKGNRFKTMALAGTQPFNGSREVSWQNKEKNEQQFVTDYILNSLNSSVDSLSVTEAKTVKAGNLLHLQSNISGLLKTELKAVLNQLHPTPAVCGLPVNDAKSFIIENESYDREYYTGYLGELNIIEESSRNRNRRNVENNAYNSNQKVSQLYVNLRCMQIKNKQALIYVGGGITKDSIPKNEWEETVSKAETMKRVLIS